MAVPRPDRMLSVCLLAAFLGSAMPCSAQRETEFLGVKSWQGSLKLKANALGTNGASGGTDAWDFQWSADFQIKLEEFIPFGQFWRGKFVGGSAAVRHKNVLTNGGCTWTNTVVGEGLPANPEFFLFVGPGNNYRLQVLDGSIPTRITVTSVCDGRTSVLTNDRPDAWFPANLGRNDRFPLPATGFDLIGGGKYPMGAPLFLVTFGFSPPTFLADLSWDFHGLASPLEVVIDPQGYDSWRPEAGADEKTPANDISVKATLQHEDGSPLSPLEKAQKFEFQLADVSSEPGITMNFPLAARALRDPDLQFDKARNERLPVIITGTDQAQSIGLPHETASVLVSSYDWGAWGTIKVTATTGDGRRIVGYLKGDKEQTAVRLPKRAMDSKIADVWKSQVGVNKPDNDDSEKDPVGLKLCDGDGLTLYEEYRGFRENGKHIEGSPNKKDLFIRNEGGATLESGISRFGDVTDLEIHRDLQPEEFDTSDRAINANSKEGAHVVLQHGVWILVCPGTDGGGTDVRNRSLRARPGLVTRICIQPPDRAGSSTEQFNLSAADAVFSYEKTVAHELLHASGVEHHGETDKHYEFKLIAASLFTNATGKAYYNVGGSDATVLDEKTLEDIAERESAKAEADLANIRAFYDFFVQLGAIQNTDGLRLLIDLQFISGHSSIHYVGLAKGQHSGDDQCIMRYFFAEYYVSLNDRNTYYKVPPGTEPSGLILCERSDGTGVNDPVQSVRPQSRYSEASPNRGACRWWVCINDAIPPGAF